MLQQNLGQTFGKKIVLALSDIEERTKAVVLLLLMHCLLLLPFFVVFVCMVLVLLCST